MNILDNYPVFENNQVLTSDQLNNLVKYLDQQNRLTRSQLIGIGTICGFHIKYDTTKNALTITKGVGITSEGFLLEQTDCSTGWYRNYDYTKSNITYSPFEDITNKSHPLDVELFELISTLTDPTNEFILSKSFLADKVVLLFLEIFDQDLKTCLAKSCDEIGQTRIFTLRKLLISTKDMDKVLQRLYVDSYDPTFPNKFELPVITIPRVNIKPDEEAAKDKSSLLKKYVDAVEMIKKDLLDAIKLTYKTYNPILKNAYANDFDIVKIIDTEVFKWDTYLNGDLYGVQYFYDFIKDLTLAYEEFKNAAFELCNECLINMERFPLHLMLGPAIPDKDYNIDSTPYRNRFIHSPAYSIQKYLTLKSRSLHQRMVSMIINFNLEYIQKPEDTDKSKDTKVKLKKTITDIHIIPSNEKLSKLSDRAIPFYYDVNKGDLPLINYWNYDIEKRKQSDYILTYQHQKVNSLDPIKNPLKFDLDKYSFLRIEGVLGKGINIIEPELNKKKVDFNLPFNVITLILNPASDKLVLNPDLWNDLNVSYIESHFRFKCLIQNLYENVQKLEKYNLEIEYITIKSSIIKTLIDDILTCLPENINDFVFTLFFNKYCCLIELMQEYRLVLTHLQGKLINVLINVIPAKDLQNKLAAIEESIDFINRILNNCTYKEFYFLYYRLIGRKKYLKENHPMIFSNFIKKNPGIDHLVGVNKGGTYLMIIEDNTTELDKNKVFAEFSLPYLCCCECTELPTIEKELDYNQLPELALPDGVICIKENKVDIDILQNDYIPYTSKFDITTNSQYAIYNSNKKLITYNRNGYLGLDTFHYTINRKISKIDNSIQTTKNELNITPNDLTSNSLFGYSLDIDQGKAIIGALRGGDKSVNSGSAYILELINNQWEQQAKLLPSDKENEDQFGCSVAISGNYAFVGAKGEDTNGSMAGSVYVFAYENNSWVEKQKLQPNDISAGDYFGCSIAIFNNLLIIGAFGKDDAFKNCGCAYLFKLEANKWVQKQKITASDMAVDDYFGYDVALYNNNLVIGAYCKDTKGNNSGCTYVYSYNGTQFIEKQKLIPYDLAADDYFGSSVAIYENTIVVGARRNDISGKNSGSVYVFSYQQNSWIEIQKLVPFDAEIGDYFGYSVDIYKDNIVIGSQYEDKGGENVGAAYIFTYENGKWRQSKKVQPEKPQSNNLFGSAVGIYNDILIIGAHKSNGSTGSIYIFSKQFEVVSNIASVKVLVREEYKPHIQAVDDFQIVQQHGELLIDVLENDFYYKDNNIELELSNTDHKSVLGGDLSIVPEEYENKEKKKLIKYVPSTSGKDSFRYKLKDIVRKEESEATVTVFVTKIDLTVPDIVYLVTSVNQNTIPISLPSGWSINSLPTLPPPIPEKMGTLTLSTQETGFIFTPENFFTNSKTLSFNYILLNEKKEPVKGIVHLISCLDEYSIPDIVCMVTKPNSNIIPLDYAVSNNLQIEKIVNLPSTIGTYTYGRTGQSIIFTPGIDFSTQNSVRFNYILKDTNSHKPSIRGTIHLINRLEEYSIPDIVFRVTNVGDNIVNINYAQQYAYSIDKVIEISPASAGSYTIDNVNRSITFKPSSSFNTSNLVTMVYRVINANKLLINGKIHLINGLEEYPVPDIVYKVTTRGSNSILIDYAQQNSLAINKVELSDSTVGSSTYANSTITFTPNLSFASLKTLKLTYHLNNNGPTIKGIVHLINGIEDIIIPDTIHQITALGKTTIPIEYTSRSGYEISGVISDIKDDIGVFTPNKDSIIFETGVNYSSQNVIRFTYVLTKSGSETLRGIGYLINSINQSEEYKDYFSDVLAGTIMAFAFDPTNSYDVVLTSLGRDESKVIEILVSITGLKLEEVKVLVASLPTTIKKGITLTEATDIAKQLTSYGATVETPNWLKQHGWLICDGMQYNRFEYSQLFRRIKTLYGSGDGKYTFNVPDLRGEFLRGWDIGKGIDANRQLGSWQGDQILTHNHIDAGHTHTDNGHTHSSNSHTHTSNAHTHSDSGHTHSEFSTEYVSVKLPRGTTGTQEVQIPHPINITTGTGNAAITSSVVSINPSAITINTGYAALLNAQTGLKEPKYISRDITKDFPHGTETRPRNISVMFCIKF